MHNKPHTLEARKKMSESHKGVPLPHNRKKSMIINGEILYHCPSCNEYKLPSEFYKNKRTFTGIKTQCKKCHCYTTTATRNIDNKRDKNREYERRKRARDIEMGIKRKRVTKRVKNEKTIARSIFHSEFKKGNIIKPENCSDCGRAIKLSGHHPDYSKPLLIEWLCYECHGKRHRKII